jgi:hypothetical protein
MRLKRCGWRKAAPCATDKCQGIDVRQLREDAAQVRAVLLATPPDEIEGFDRAMLKPVPRITYD